MLIDSRMQNQSKSNSPSVNDVIAFAVVELNTPLPYDTLLDMTVSDPLYLAIIERWKIKQDREMGRYALVASVIANVMGGNKTSPSDFYNPISDEEKKIRNRKSEESVRSMFIRHNARVRAEAKTDAA